MRKLLTLLTLLPTLLFADRLIPTQDCMIEVKDTTHQVIITHPNSTRDTLRIGRIEHWFGQTIVDLYDGDAVRMAKVTRDSVFFYKARFEFKTARTVKTQPAAYSKTRK